MEIDFFFSFHGSKNEAYKKTSLEKPKTLFMTYGKMLFFFQKQIAVAMTLAFDF